MSRRVLARRPSPAMLVAIVALVAAMAGTAVAGGGFLAKTKKKSTVLQRLTYVNETQSVGLSDTNTDTDPKTVSASCPAGYHPVGGGVKLTTPAGGSHRYLWWSDGYLTETGFTSRVFNETGSSATALVSVACVAGKAKGAGGLAPAG